MRGDEFIKSLLCLRAFRDAGDQGLDGMEAVCFVFRNRQNSGWWNGDWLQILKHHADVSAYLKPNETEFPNPTSYNFQRLLQEIDNIFNGTREDDISTPKDSILAVRPKPLYFGRLDQIDNPFFLENISRNPEHKRIAQVGSLTLWT